MSNSALSFRSSWPWLPSRLASLNQCAVGFFFGNSELSPEFWTVIAGLSGFGD